MSSRKLYGVIYGKLYANSPPSHAHSCWMASASEIGKTGWEDFRHLFFHPDGTLYGVLNDKFYKGRPPSGSSSEDWIANAELIGKSGWDSFKLLFFDPDGMLYGVEGDKLYKGAPPANSDDANFTDRVTVSPGSTLSAVLTCFVKHVYRPPPPTPPASAS